MRRLTKNLILATAVVSVIVLVDLSTAEATSYCHNAIYYTFNTETSKQYLDFWGKFRDTVMPDPDEPQNNNPPKEMEPPPEEDDSESQAED